MNGKMLNSISEPGKGAAVFKVASEDEVKDIFKHMIGKSDLSMATIHPKGILFPHTMEDGSKTVLRNFSNSQDSMVPHWTIEFAKIPDVWVSRVEIKLVIDHE